MSTVEELQYEIVALKSELRLLKNPTPAYPCPDCGGPMTGLPSTAQKICGGCQKYRPWKLSEGQKPVGYSVCPDKINEIMEDSE